MLLDPNLICRTYTDYSSHLQQAVELHVTATKLFDIEHSSTSDFTLQDVLATEVVTKTR